MQQPYDVGQPLGAFGSIPKSQYSQTQVSSNLFKPDSVRCQEVDETSTSASSVVEPSKTPVSSVHSPDATIDKIREPDLKRKAETEIVETLKKTRVESKAEAEGPAASNKDPTEMNTELDRPLEITLALPQAYRDLDIHGDINESIEQQIPISTQDLDIHGNANKSFEQPTTQDQDPISTEDPSVDDALPNHNGPSQQSYKRPIELTIGDANAPTKSKADAVALDPSKTPPMTSHRTILHHEMKSRRTLTSALLHHGIKSRGTLTPPRAPLYHGIKSRGTLTSAPLHHEMKSRITPGDLENSSTVVEKQLLAEFVDALETSAQASTTCLSPELPYHSLPFKASKSVCKNEHPPDSLLRSSLDDLPDLVISPRVTAPSNSPRDSSFSHETPDAIPSSLGKNKAKNQHIASHERLAAPEKRTFRMLLELESTLKVAQDVPMPRAKPNYDSCYHLALSDLEEGDVNADSSEDSEYMNDSGDDEDEGSVTLDNPAEYSDEEELGNDEVKPRSTNLTPDTTAGKDSAKAQNVYVFIKREAEK